MATKGVIKGFGMDVPMERPDAGGRAAVFVPKAGADDAVRESLRNGSGMCGFANLDGTVMIYFENNKFNDPGLAKWESKVFKAYDRLVNLAPTVNKLTCSAGSVEQVGVVKGHEILVTEMDLLKQWLKRSNAEDSAPDGPEIYV